MQCLTVGQKQGGDALRNDRDAIVHLLIITALSEGQVGLAVLQQLHIMARATDVTLMVT